MSKRKEDISIRISAGEYLSYIASAGNGVRKCKKIKLP